MQNAYALAFGGLLLLGARAGDILGRRRMFITGIAFFTAASLAVGLAQSPAWLNVAYRLGGSLGLGVLVTVFAAPGSATLSAHALLAHRISVSLTAGSGMLVAALILVVTLIVRPHRATR